jgi:hypothetical protein
VSGVGFKKMKEEEEWPVIFEWIYSNARWLATKPVDKTLSTVLNFSHWRNVINSDGILQIVVSSRH